ncbi:unnamed protein product [Danaus chrysippus]|uniref:(African queen) hypothetical protein n=1 Tax=Danaus chrysippus TaxID=151541 RepID=A0A8J2R6B3_9NEOP|nr:unnamed protein product [Danaus chrysippus]
MNSSNTSENIPKLDKKNSKTMTQQLFHKGMFMNRPRSNSFSGTTNQDKATIDLSDVTVGESEDQQYTEVHYGKRLRSSPDASIPSQKQAKLNYWVAAPTVSTSNSFIPLDDIVQAHNPETQAP